MGGRRVLGHRPRRTGLGEERGPREQEGRLKGASGLAILMPSVVWVQAFRRGAQEPVSLPR